MVCWGGFQVISIQNVASGVWMSMELWVRSRRWNLLVMVATKMQGKKGEGGAPGPVILLGQMSEDGGHHKDRRGNTVAMRGACGKIRV